MRKPRDRSRMTPSQRAWDTQNNPDVEPVNLTQRQKLAHLYRNLYRLGFGPFAAINADAEGAGEEYFAAEKTLRTLCERLEAQPCQPAKQST